MSLKSLIIRGGIPLSGEIRIHGSKNAVLPILAAALLGKGPVVIENCPEIGDVKDTLRIMETLGCGISREGSTVSIDTSLADGCCIEKEEASRIRSSVLFLGALLGRIKKAVLPQPGGCAIGARPIDLHLQSLRELGASITEHGEALSADGVRMHAARIRLRFPSVGATENIILAAVTLSGETIVEHAAREPEVDQLCEFLNLRGAKIRREMDGTIRICGGAELGPVRYQMKADRIVTGTYLLAAAAARGRICIGNYPGELEALLLLLQKMGGEICREGEALCFAMRHRPRSLPLVETAPYPGFPTDLQSPLMAVLAGADGVSRVKENLFENRFRTAGELAKMGAEIVVDGSEAVITGKSHLSGAQMKAPDLRGGAALAIAALLSAEESRITKAEYVERGYEDIARDLRLLGAKARWKAS